MKRRKVVFPKVENIWDNGSIKIYKDNQDYFFEIGKEITTDIGEAVAILMRCSDVWNNNSLWEITIDNKVDPKEITPEKSLYWLSGGDKEWMTLENYSTPWHQIALTFQEEYGMIIVTIISKAKTLKDIRDGFLKHVSLPTLYDFAVKHDMVC